MPARRAWRSAILSALGAVLASITGCGPEFILSTSNLEIGPNPARPGDVLVASFILTLVPTQSHTIIVFIDNDEHLRVTSNDAPAIPMVLELGDAADLIDTYGTGMHSAHVEVHLNDEDRSARSQSVSFELQAASAGLFHILPGRRVTSRALWRTFKKSNESVGATGA